MLARYMPRSNHTLAYIARKANVISCGIFARGFPAASPRPLEAAVFSFLQLFCGIQGHWAHNPAIFRLHHILLAALCWGAFERHSFHPGRSGLTSG